MKKAAAGKTLIEIAVVVTTAHRGVFFGYTTDASGDVIKLRAARNCIRWRGTKGFLGLVSDGPNALCRIGPAADIELRNITCVGKCTDKSIAAWEAAPWS